MAEKKKQTAQTQDPQQKESQEKKKTPPSHDLFLARDTGKGGTNWLRIGAAWPHKDGSGFSVRLDGDLVLRERRER